MKLTSVITGFMIFTYALFLPQTAGAHGAQERLYSGTLCKLRGDALRGDGEFSVPMWQYLGVSQFGFIENISRTTDIPVICPIERGVIRKGTGITVAVKYNVWPTENYSGTPNAPPFSEFRCTLVNVNRPGTGPALGGDDPYTGPPLSVTASRDLLDELQGVPRILTLSLNESNSSKNFDDTAAGAYVLGCWLPKIHEEPGRYVLETRLIHYIVRERD